MARSLSRRTMHVLAAGVIAGTVVSAAAAAPPKADKHDRAALKQLIAQQLVMPTKADAALLAIASACPAWNAPGVDRGELTASLVVPAEYRFRDAHASRYAAYRTALAHLAPHSIVIRRWVPTERYSMALTVRYWKEFDSSRLDVCGYLNEVAVGGDWDAAEPLLYINAPRNLSATQSYWHAMAATVYRPERIRFEAFLRASGFTNDQVVALMAYH